MEEVDLPLSFPENEEQIIESYSDDGTVLYEEIALDVDEGKFRDFTNFIMVLVKIQFGISARIVAVSSGV